jgi:large subunit ribosomal protein L31
MKANIHPAYKPTVAKCACGNEIEVGSTTENIRVEICSKCHPFYTGNRSRIVDTTGRVDRFKKKYGLQ